MASEQAQVTRGDIEDKLAHLLEELPQHLRLGTTGDGDPADRIAVTRDGNFIALDVTARVPGNDARVGLVKLSANLDVRSVYVLVQQGHRDPKATGAMNAFTVFRVDERGQYDIVLVDAEYIKGRGYRPRFTPVRGEQS